MTRERLILQQVAVYLDKFSPVDFDELSDTALREFIDYRCSADQLPALLKEAAKEVDASY